MPARTSSSAFLWILFVALAFAWGSSYFFIKVGVEAGMLPFNLVGWRLAISVVGLGLLVAVTRSRVPRDPRVLAKIAVMGIVYVAIPFSLITWAEQSIDSALAAILQALTPLFALIIAAVVLHDEPITVNKVGGLVLGFAGAVVILARHVAPAAGVDPGGELTGEIALVLSCLSYAIGATYLRRTIGTRPLMPDPVTGPRALRPVEIALPQNIVALLIIAPLAAIFEPASGLAAPPTTDAWVSVIWLGLIGSGIAYLMFYRLINAWGVYRSSLITYVMPVIGILLGVIVLGETIGVQTFIGTAMVIGGVALANAPIGQRRLFGRAAPTVSRHRPLEGPITPD
ncbi:MAG TPA: EamA family transporter [Candidatus Limnocylindrales bacterium]|jgi:drug/metabolite transporter (DMT)-like permease